MTGRDVTRADDTPVTGALPFALAPLIARKNIHDNGISVKMKSFTIKM